MNFSNLVIEIPGAQHAPSVHFAGQAWGLARSTSPKEGQEAGGIRWDHRGLQLLVLYRKYGGLFENGDTSAYIWTGDVMTNGWIWVPHVQRNSNLLTKSQDYTVDDWSVSKIDIARFASYGDAIPVANYPWFMTLFMWTCASSQCWDYPICWRVWAIYSYGLAQKWGIGRWGRFTR